MNIATPSSDRFSLRAWTISFCIHAVTVGGAIGLVRHSPVPIQPPPLRLDLQLVESETPSASAPGQLTENESLAPESSEPEPPQASTPATEQPPVTPTPPVQQLDTRPVTTPARQETARPVTNSHATALDAPKPVTQPHPVSATASKEARPSVSDRTDTQSPLAQQEQTTADSSDALTSPPSATPPAPPSTPQTSPSEQADAGNQPSPPSTQPAALATDSGVSSAQETSGSADSPATNAGENRPAISARTSSSRPDYSWLATALRRRVANLLTYPHHARLQGWKGRVVVRVTIKDDGSLLDAQVAESSGYEALDDDAIRLMQRVCPIPLQHDIRKPQVVLLVPIQYRFEP